MCFTFFDFKIYLEALMSEPPGNNNFRPAYPPGQPSQHPGPSFHGQQPIGVNPPDAGAGTNYNRPSGALYPGAPAASTPYNAAPPPNQTSNAPQFPTWNNNNAPQPPAWNNGYAPGGNFPPQPPTGSSQNWGPNSIGNSFPPQSLNPKITRNLAPQPFTTPPFASPQVKKRRLIARLRNRYTRLSKRGKILSLVLVVALLIPSILGISEVVNGLILYNQVKSGIGHIQAVQTIFHGGASDDYAKYFDPAKLQQAQSEITAAHSDFSSLSDELDHDSSIGIAGALAPAQISTARSLGHIAVDATTIGEKLIATAIEQSPSMVKTLQASAADKDTAHPKPFVTEAAFVAFNQDLNTLLPQFQDMSDHLQGLALNSLPINASESKMVSSILPLIPTIYTLLSQGPDVRNALGWLIGCRSTAHLSA